VLRPPPRFPIYLSRLYHLLRADTDASRVLGSLVLVGGMLLLALHAVSDIGITALLGAKLASFAAQHDQGLAYTLNLLTFALDSVGRWLGWLSILVGILFFLRRATSSVTAG
jgi:hypothetical protein